MHASVCVCVCVRMCACVHACVRSCVCARVFRATPYHYWSAYAHTNSQVLFFSSKFSQKEHFVLINTSFRWLLFFGVFFPAQVKQNDNQYIWLILGLVYTELDWSNTENYQLTRTLSLLSLAFETFLRLVSFAKRQKNC